MSRLKKAGQWLVKPFVWAYRRIYFRFFFKWKPQLVRIVPGRRDLRDRPGRVLNHKLTVQPLVPHINDLPICVNMADLIKIAMKDGMEMDIRPGEGSDFVLQCGDLEGTFDRQGQLLSVGGHREPERYAEPYDEASDSKIVHTQMPERTFDQLIEHFSKHHNPEKKT